MSAKPNELGIYFQPGQIIFHVIGDLKGRDQDLTGLIHWANGLAEKKGVTIRDPEVLTFGSVHRSVSSPYQRETRQAKVRSAVAGTVRKLPPFRTIFQTGPQAKAPPTFSLVSATVEKGDWPSYENTEDRAVEEKQKTAFAELFELIVILDKNRGGAPVTLKAVTPNWLTTGTSKPGSTGGPGGRPSTADATVASTRTFRSGQHFLGGIPSRAGAVPGPIQGVAVAILDTCYPQEKWDEIRTKWATHELIPTLLGPAGGAGGILKYHPDPAVDGYLPGLKFEGHDYDMTDHGLFIASIIHRLAPQAELHLYQVLNPHGLGDLLQIARTLGTVRNDFSGRLDKLIINMSLTLNLPLQEEHIAKDDEIGRLILNEKQKGEWFWNLIHWICRILQWLLRWVFPNLVLSCRGSWSDRQALAFEWISDLVHVLDSGMIAAAGNNGSKGYRPSACYPAAFDSVLGVGALSRGAPWNAANPLRPASYSDLADTPTTQGVTVFGGEEGEGNGVPGVYVGKLPDGTDNSTGWAWWSGTSFAAPIISGLAAALVISGSAASAREAIVFLLNTSTQWTPAFEDIIPVEP